MDTEVIRRRKCVISVGSLQGLWPFRTTDWEEGLDVSKPIEIESSRDLEDGGSMVLRNFRINKFWDKIIVLFGVVS